MSFIESMVVIRLLPDPAFVAALPTDNGGDSRNAEDLRNSELSVIDRVLQRIPFLRAHSSRARFCRAAVNGRVNLGLFNPRAALNAVTAGVEPSKED